MRAGKLTSILEPFKQVAVTNSVIADYRNLQISRNAISARTAHAAIDATLSLGLTDPCAVDTRMLYSVVKSLPASEEVSFELQGKELVWKCSAARGRLATSPVREHKALPDRPGTLTKAEPRLREALSLGAMSASNSALSSIGLFGVQLKPLGEQLWIMSSDNVTQAVGVAHAPKLLSKTATFAATEVELIASMLAYPDAGVAFLENAAYVADDTLRAVISHVPPLKYDLYGICEAVLADDAVVPLMRERVQAFVSRATFLAETRQKCRVRIRAEKQQLTLHFEEDLAQTDEYYLIDGFSVDEPSEVVVDAVKLGEALLHCDEMLLDAMERKQLVFRAKDKSFYYIVASRA